MTKFAMDNYITGRLRRKDYWLMTLLLFIILLIAAELNIKGILPQAIYMIIITIFMIIQVIMQIRRLHDRDKSSWWLLILWIPLIGALWLGIELGFLRGTIGANHYGPDPVSR